MVGDGNADFAKAIGLELDLTPRGMGVRLQRFAMIVEDGVVKHLNVEAPGKFEVSSAEQLMALRGGEIFPRHMLYICLIDAVPFAGASSGSINGRILCLDE